MKSKPALLMASVLALAAVLLPQLAFAFVEKPASVAGEGDGEETATRTAPLAERQRDHRLLAIFDLDGTLFVSAGREIIHHGGDCAAIHPLMEPHVEAELDAADLVHDYTFVGSGAGDEFRLIERASTVEPIAQQLRQYVADGHKIAILSARGHDASWLAERLERKLHLEVGSIDPRLVQTVYSKRFEETSGLPMHGPSAATPARKALAFEMLLEASGASEVHYFDDVEDNLKTVLAHALTHSPRVTVHTHFVPYALSVEACERAGVDIRELLHFGCRTDGTPSPLAQTLLANPVARQRLGDYVRPPRPTAAVELPP